MVSFFAHVVFLSTVVPQSSGGWWWNATDAGIPPEPPPWWNQWERIQDVRDYLGSAALSWNDVKAKAGTWAESLGGWTMGLTFDSGFWGFIDGCFSIFGWAVFRSAWNGVRTGCRRLVQLGAVVTVCLMAHYAWTFCWPVVSLLLATLSALIWLVRKGTRLMGWLLFWAHRSLGGAPEVFNFPVCESTAASGRYPKQWNQPKWQAILQRPDVEWVEFPMCAFGLGPGGNEFYVHRTRVVFPVHPPLRRVLNRPCPGVGPNHQHVPLKGARPGATVSRCTEAGAYCEGFVQAVVQCLQATLTGRGGSRQVIAMFWSSRKSWGSGC